MSNDGNRTREVPEQISQSVKELASESPEPLRPENTLQEAGDKMRALRTENFPVAADRHIVGLMKGQNPDRSAAGHGHDPNATSVRESMSTEIIYCFEDQSCSEVEQLMLDKQLDHLPVVDRDLRIVGIVSLEDIARKKERELERVRQAVAEHARKK